MENYDIASWNIAEKIEFGNEQFLTVLKCIDHWPSVHNTDPEDKTEEDEDHSQRDRDSLKEIADVFREGGTAFVRAGF